MAEKAFIESPEAAYERGQRAGEVDARLNDHDRKFEKINGSMDRFALEMKSLAMAVQRLGDQAISRDATVVTTAAALKDAEEARRDKADRKYTPMERLITALGAAGVCAGSIIAYYSTHH